MTENWRDIPGFDGRYMVSDLGRVRSLVRPRILRPAYDNRGALVVSLPCKRFASGYRATKVHLLVLLTFVGPCPKGQIGRHLDGNPYNNALSNLAYGTYKENSLDRDMQGNSGSARLTEAQVIEIRTHPRYFGYQRDLAVKYGVDRRTVSQLITGRTWKHVK